MIYSYLYLWLPWWAALNLFRSNNMWRKRPMSKQSSMRIKWDWFYDGSIKQAHIVTICIFCVQYYLWLLLIYLYCLKHIQIQQHVTKVSDVKTEYNVHKLKWDLFVNEIYTFSYTHHILFLYIFMITIMCCPVQLFSSNNMQRKYPMSKKYTMHIKWDGIYLSMKHI